jgi:hypothetical protein
LVDDGISSSLGDDYIGERNASIYLPAQEFFLLPTPALAGHHISLSKLAWAEVPGYNLRIMLKADGPLAQSRMQSAPYTLRRIIATRWNVCC